jgi:CubicO group peptidase (beta-lactamase class C family)
MGTSVDRRVDRPIVAMYALALVVVMLGGCATGGSWPSTEVSASDAQRIDALLKPYSQPGTPGAVVVVINRGRVAFLRGYGLANIDTKTPFTDRTNVRLASLTKAFTAMAIMLLVNDGALRLDDHVRDVLPDFPSYGQAIRIRHLLSHTSGLRAYQELIPPGLSRPLKDRDVLTLLHRTDTLLFPPGSAFRYGDSGYAVLALVVEAVSGKPFARFLNDRIFAPADMGATLAYEPGGRDVPNRALGYVATSAGFRIDDQNITSTVLGDGGIYSSAHDLIAWDRALDHHRLVPAPLQSLAWAPATLDDGTPTRYGFGWYLDRAGTEPYVFHRGETTGFTHVIVKYPTRRLTVVVLTNRRGGAPDEIATTITKLASFRPA